MSTLCLRKRTSADWTRTPEKGRTQRWLLDVLTRKRPDIRKAVVVRSFARGQAEATAGLYQPPYALTVLAHGRVAMEVMVSGAAVSAFQAWQQASTMSA